MKEVVRVGFVDFWGGYCPEKEFIYKALARSYDVIIDNKKPDFLFYSCFGLKHLKYTDCVRICYYGENLFPNYNICDYSLSCVRDSIGGRNLWTAQCLRYNGEDALPPVNEELAKRRFCNFLYSQDKQGAGAAYRKEVCQQLMKYKHVDCPGRILHNVDVPELSSRGAGDWHASKIRFLQQYKFTMAYENTNSDGYMTEKLLDPLKAGSVPIYWGGEGNIAPFSRDCMICAYDYPNIESLIERIKEVDNDDELYLSMCRANPLRNSVLGDWEQEVGDFLTHIIQRGNRPLSKDELRLDPIHQLHKSATMNLLRRCAGLMKRKLVSLFRKLIK